MKNKQQDTRVRITFKKNEHAIVKENAKKAGVSMDLYIRLKSIDTPLYVINYELIYSLIESIITLTNSINSYVLIVVDNIEFVPFQIEEIQNSIEEIENSIKNIELKIIKLNQNQQKEKEKSHDS